MMNNRNIHHHLEKVILQDVGALHYIYIYYTNIHILYTCKSKSKVHGRLFPLFYYTTVRLQKKKKSHLSRLCWTGRDPRRALIAGNKALP